MVSDCVNTIAPKQKHAEEQKRESDNVPMNSPTLFSEDSASDGGSRTRNSEAILFAYRSKQITETLGSIVKSLTKTVAMLKPEEERMELGCAGMKKAVKHLIRHQERNTETLLEYIRYLEETVQDQDQEIESCHLENEALLNRIGILEELSDGAVHSATACNSESQNEKDSGVSLKLFSSYSSSNHIPPDSKDVNKEHKQIVPSEITVQNLSEERVEL